MFLKKNHKRPSWGWVLSHVMHLNMTPQGAVSADKESSDHDNDEGEIEIVLG